MTENTSSEPEPEPREGVRAWNSEHVPVGGVPVLKSQTHGQPIPHSHCHLPWAPGKEPSPGRRPGLFVLSPFSLALSGTLLPLLFFSLPSDMRQDAEVQVPVQEGAKRTPPQKKKTNLSQLLVLSIESARTLDLCIDTSGTREERRVKGKAWFAL